MQPLSGEDPQVIGGYRLLGRIGAGGMGRVYLGRSAGGRTVAVKVVHPHFAADEQFRARFRREVAAARRVGGAWTAPVLDADCDSPVPWVATGYVAGPSIGQAVAEVGPLPAATVRAAGAGLAEALSAVHARGLVHRDVKPSNVLLTLDGPCLIDFGIARAMDGTASLTTTGVSVGSPGYMAPEQILGKSVTGSADVFSLGAVLAYAATGAPPFVGDNSAVLLYKVVHEEPELGEELTGDLRDLVASCLAKEPDARPSPAELARRLAPERGASGLLVPGWLPAPLVERVSRQAVELLNLEVEADTAAGDAPGGPVRERAGAAAPADGAPGGVRQRMWRVGRGAGGAAAVADRPADAPEPGGAGRRRVSCTLVVTVAGALAAVLLGTLLPGLLEDKSPERPSPAAPAPGATVPPPAASTAPSDGPQLPAVPEAFVGTWTGQVVQADGTPNGTMTSVVTGGGKDELVVRTTYSVLGVLECRAKARLLSATAQRIALEEVTDGEPRPGCTGEKALVTYTLAPGGRLAFASDDPKGGTPRATLTRKGR
ncbi:serine/threonine protein kinase [Streptomyces mashuensis]|uniref:Serine/threonine protein kinase n=1 Tax=Streptomyces mashuensis TaxID=33904 RepID=A0A919B6E3_9ACTN|nr:serine/threonine-protein kinase [Streptomyces mashuensis]GHF56529.1 serine/threonine protein kinase [Streptomyces mashuensis]